MVEATGHIGPPKRYLSVRGQFLEHAPYCERDLRGPAEPLLVDGDEVDVLVQHRRGWTRLTYAHHPFDVVGWDGCLYPWAFSIHDFEPITGRVHQPPPVHQTFEGPNFVICSFVPRKVDYHPLAIPVPYNHHNVDSDEMLFYTGGNYEARRGSGIEQGSISLHPSRLHPRPPARRGRARDRGRTTSTSWRSWSTRSARSTSCDAGARLRGPRLRLDLGPSARAARRRRSPLDPAIRLIPARCRIRGARTR